MDLTFIIPNFYFELLLFNLTFQLLKFNFKLLLFILTFENRFLKPP